MGVIFRSQFSQRTLHLRLDIDLDGKRRDRRNRFTLQSFIQSPRYESVRPVGQRLQQDLARFRRLTPWRTVQSPLKPMLP